MAYNKEQLEDALVALWKMAWEELELAQQQKLMEEYCVFMELDQFGERGPVGLGLGNYGGHVLGSEEENE